MKKLMYVSAISIAILSGCAGTKTTESTHHWNYNNIDKWSELDHNFGACSNGKIQTPIDIRPNIKFTELPKLEIKYNYTPLRVVNNGHSIQVNTDKGLKFKVGEESYELLQFHFHTPSENHIDGKEYPIEMHLVNKDEKGNLAVISVMFDEGRANSEIAKIWKAAPKTEGESTGSGNIDIAKLLPKDLTHYSRFTGSLTTPPCSEGVSWFVLDKPMTLSKEQIKQFQKLYKHNARPIQPTNNRVIIGS